jgi:hypothetical protein
LRRRYGKAGGFVIWPRPVNRDQRASAMLARAAVANLTHTKRGTTMAAAVAFSRHDDSWRDSRPVAPVGGSVEAVAEQQR